jgi:hypothetical protein
MTTAALCKRGEEEGDDRLRLGQRAGEENEIVVLRAPFLRAGYGELTVTQSHVSLDRRSQ